MSELPWAVEPHSFSHAASELQPVTKQTRRSFASSNRFRTILAAIVSYNCRTCRSTQLAAASALGSPALRTASCPFLRLLKGVVILRTPHPSDASNSSLTVPCSAEAQLPQLKPQRCFANQHSKAASCFNIGSGLSQTCVDCTRWLLGCLR